MLKLAQRPINKYLIEAGYRRGSRAYSKNINDLISYFVWERPFKHNDKTLIRPSVRVLSLPLLHLTVEPAAKADDGWSQLVIDFSNLHKMIVQKGQGQMIQGWPISAEEWQSSSNHLYELLTDCAIPILENILTTDLLCSTLEHNLWMGMASKNRILWDCGVWQGRINPDEISWPMVRDHFKTLDQNNSLIPKGSPNKEVEIDRISILSRKSFGSIREILEAFN